MHGTVLIGMFTIINSFQPFVFHSKRLNWRKLNSNQNQNIAVSDEQSTSGISWSISDGVIDDKNIPKGFRSGFVTIIGCPNAGKSTAMNAILGDKLSIVTPKPQTTRHKIMGVVSKQNFQFAFYDTPGLLEPKYKLQRKMMDSVRISLNQVNIVLAVVDGSKNTPSVELESVLNYVINKKTKLVIGLNKMDLVGSELTRVIDKELKVNNLVNEWSIKYHKAHIVPMTATKDKGCDVLMKKLESLLPLGHPLYHADTLTDKSEKFFAAEIIREKIFELYGLEIPYASQVEIEYFKDTETLLSISAIIFLERKSQVSIIIGKNGLGIKRLVNQSKINLNKFFHKNIFLVIDVKIKKDWRHLDKQLELFGYGQ